MILKLEHLLLAFGGALLVAATVLGFSGASADGASCGAVFGGGDNQDAFVQDLSTSMTTGKLGSAQDDCKSALSSRKTWTMVTGIPGMGLAVGGVAVAVIGGRRGGGVRRGVERPY